MVKKEREAYEISLKHYRDYYNSIEYAKYEASKEARKEGREEGLREGSIKIATKLKVLGIPVATIQESTGLTPEEIERL